MMSATATQQQAPGQPQQSDAGNPHIEQYRIDGIRAFLDDEKGLDIFQLLAFKIKTDKLYRSTQDRITSSGNKGRKAFGYYTEIIRALISIFTQASTVIVLYYHTFNTTISDSDKGFCDGDGEVSTKIMAISYTLFLASICYQLNDTMMNSGFYLYLSYERNDYNFISSEILHFGRMFNCLILVNIYFINTLIIFYSEDPLDIVLNSLALLFLVDIDNMMIYHKDYKRVLVWFNDDSNINSITMQPMSKERMWCWISLYYTISGLSAMLLAYVFMLGAPIFVAICY